MSGSLDPYPHADLSSFKSAIEMLCFSIAVVQLPFASLACLCIDIRYLLNAWVIIHSYDDHVRLLLPNLRSSMLQSLTGPQWSRQCYEIKWISSGLPVIRPELRSPEISRTRCSLSALAIWRS